MDSEESDKDRGGSFLPAIAVVPFNKIQPEMETSTKDNKSQSLQIEKSK